ncbi:hypothetical protein [Natrialbaceae archaeon AArc-T1-2]|uniref:hypothetical protein n=1 Tax=Natrialbaceae archaeon AArc-T1-2 TaxID=3053904 RepID=UPI00255AF2C1|nr:hypothetical protein [Natrialbaceae archaeon AArc-T1-2]WIV66608.1 hypothetical protein QQ977_13040 [Natrialbaceae archaeon AArc-T1-2]
MTEDNTAAGDVSGGYTTERDDRSTFETVSSAASNGTLALLAGGVMLTSGLRALARRRVGGVLKLGVGAALVGVGLRQRRSSGEDEGPMATEREPAGEGRIDTTDVTFGEGKEPRSKPDLEGDADDPRRDTDDEPVEIDLSPSATADEPGEAVGPDPEQAQPTRTEDTEPEESPDEDVSHREADVPDAESESESDDSAEETDAAADEDEETDDS